MHVINLLEKLGGFTPVSWVPPCLTPQMMVSSDKSNSLSHTPTQIDYVRLSRLNFSYATQQVRHIARHIINPRRIDDKSRPNEIVSWTQRTGYTKLWMQVRSVPRNFHKKNTTLVRCTDKFLGNGLLVQLVGSYWMVVRQVDWSDFCAHLTSLDRTLLSTSVCPSVCLSNACTLQIYANMSTSYDSAFF